MECFVYDFKQREMEGKSLALQIMAAGSMYKINCKVHNQVTITVTITFKSPFTQFKTGFTIKKKIHVLLEC